MLSHYYRYTIFALGVKPNLFQPREIPCFFQKKTQVPTAEAIFSFVPQGASSAHMVLGQVPHYAVKPGTLVWSDAEALHGGVVMCPVMGSSPMAGGFSFMWFYRFLFM